MKKSAFTVLALSTLLAASPFALGGNKKDAAAKDGKTCEHCKKEKCDKCGKEHKNCKCKEGEHAHTHEGAAH